MTEWHCFKDKVPMERTQVKMRYLDLVQHVPGLKCPVCGTAYLTEDIVIGVVREAEQLLEEK